MIIATDENQSREELMNLLLSEYKSNPSGSAQARAPLGEPCNIFKVATLPKSHPLCSRGDGTHDFIKIDSQKIIRQPQFSSYPT